MLRLSKYKKIFLLIIITIGLLWTISATSVPREQMSLPQKIVGYIILPIQKSVNFLYVHINDTYNFFQEIGTLKSEKETLTLKLQESEDEVRQLQNLKVENQRLRQMLDLKNEYKNYVFENAQVIGRNPENWNSIILIDKGSNDGLKVNNQVLSLNKGLVGRIIEIGPNWSKVMLITDPDSSISSLVDRTRDITVARGDSTASDDGYIKLTYVLPDADIVTDDVIITSGFGGIFSKGILIGKVKEIHKESNDLMKYAYIEPATDFTNLEAVLVIKSVIE